MDPDDPLLGQRLGNFRITGQLGQGGMGVVYLADHATLPTRAAVKVLLAEYARDRDLVKRFLDEAHVAAGINDPHVVRVFDAGLLPDGRPYLVMELLHGESLHKTLEAGPMPLARALSILRQVAGAVGTVHHFGILHRDLKPENVQLTKGNRGEDLAKVLDFGLAKPQGLEKGVTTAGTIVGTPEYMSPEQAQGGALDTRSDIYSFGCIAYATLTGVAPFEAESAVGLLVAHVSTPAADVRHKRPDAPASLAALILACMAKSRDERPPSMEVVVQHLAAIAREVEQHGQGATQALPSLVAAPPASVASPFASTLEAPSPMSPMSPTGIGTLASSPSTAASTSAAPAAPSRSGARPLLAIGLVVALGALGAGSWLLLKNKGESPRGDVSTAASASKVVAPSAAASGSALATNSEEKNPYTVADQGAVIAGNAVWTSRCARCHGARGDGNGSDIPKDGRRPRNFSDVVLPPGTLDVYWFHIVRQGIERSGGEAMPAFKDKLANKEVWQVVTFMNTLRPKPRKVDVAKELAAGAPPWSPELRKRGEFLYATRCSGCHGDTLEGDGPAANMLTDPPTNLKSDGWKDANVVKGEDDVQHIFRIVTTGSGEYMGSFSSLATADRWAIARYVNQVRTSK